MSHQLDESHGVMVPADEEKLGSSTQVNAINETFTSEESRRVCRKIDLYVLPVMWALFTLTFMDKQALNYSAVWGLKKDLKLVGQDFAWAGSLFYFGYFTAQLIFPPVVHKVPVAKFCAAIIAVWSIVLMTMPACTNYSGLLANRFFLGLAEGGLTPGFIVLTSMFYTRSEQALRASVWITGNAFGNIFGGVLGYAFGSSSTHLAKWKMFPLVFGGISLGFGLLFLYVVPSTLDGARFLSEDEKRIAILRIRQNMTGTHTGKYDSYEVKEALIDPKTWLLAAMSFFNNLQASGPGTFGSQIVSSFGFSALDTTVLQSVPTGGFQAICTLAFGYIAATRKDTRLLLMGLANVPPIIGGACLYHFSKSSKALLAAYVLVYSGPATQAMTFGFVSSNIAGYTKKSIVSAIVLLTYSAAQIAGPHFFLEPPYTLGFGMMMVCYAACILLAVVMYVYLRWENNRRDKAAVHAESELSETAADEADLTDFQRKATFRYAL